MTLLSRACVSHWYSIETMSVSGTVFPIFSTEEWCDLEIIGKGPSYPMHSTPPLGDPRLNIANPFGTKN